MNKGEMKRLGDYIREVDVRNRDLEVTKLLGVSISKEFMPSIANTIGTDMSSYKIVEPRQFAYGPVTSRNGDKVSIALYKDDEKAIVSQAYTIFEVKNKQELLPEYLMMWFRRPEFDRYARFKSHGSAREIFSWEEMCDVELPIPPIEQQQKVVSEYEAVTRRIRLNEQIIAKLEETAQALYRKMFVDGIDKENLPEGWRMGTLGEIAKIKAGGDKPKVFSNCYTDQCQIPVVANGIENQGIIGYTEHFVINERAITISARGTIGVCFVRTRPYCPIVRLISVIPYDKSFLHNLWFQLSRKQFEGDGSVQNQLTIPVLEREEVIVPDHKTLDEFEKRMSLISNAIELNAKQNKKLTELLSLLLAKMVR
ncbi:restriction endonuclease subunit S [Parabacteroides distasonis]|uniref:restriction endonuclease subunit S n=1 Tax=Parabacteroides distasonis TaxID=823 RepID=UPI001F3EA563|nr:restriction endonuclease subunit S [Parabacteroides distasonis]MCE9061107.1 restriction endonuclease subunit S [Parabacteroides distasonis]